MHPPSTAAKAPRGTKAGETLYSRWCAADAPGDGVRLSSC